MRLHPLFAAAATVIAAVALIFGTTDTASATPRPDPWLQGQVDKLTEDVPGYLRAIDRSGIDRGGIDDRGLVIRGHAICGRIYDARGDLGSAALPRTHLEDVHTMEVVAGASVRYLCWTAGRYVAPDILAAVP